MLSCSRRESSTTAPQSLTLLNGQFTLRQAEALAEQALPAAGDDEAVGLIFRRVLARLPNASEVAMAHEFLTKQTQLTGGRKGALSELARGLLNTNEFLYVD